VGFGLLLFMMLAWLVGLLAPGMMNRLPPAGEIVAAAGAVAIPVLGMVCGSVYGYFVWRRKVLFPLRQLAWRLRENSDCVEALTERAEMYLNETHQYSLAIEDASRAIALREGRWELYQVRAAANANLRNHAGAALDVTMAITLLAEGNELTPEHWWLYAWRADLHRELNQVEREIEDATEALIQALKFEVPSLVTAVRHMLSGRFEPWVNRAIRRRALARLFYQRATAYRKVGNAKASRADWRAARRHDPLGFWDPGPVQRYLLGGLFALGISAALYWWFIEQYASSF
jgi:tetratricopeptide (TPR) repeat protein